MNYAKKGVQRRWKWDYLEWFYLCYFFLVKGNRFPGFEWIPEKDFELLRMNCENVSVCGKVCSKPDLFLSWGRCEKDFIMRIYTKIWDWSRLYIRAKCGVLVKNWRIRLALEYTRGFKYIFSNYFLLFYIILYFYLIKKTFGKNSLIS